MTSHAQVSLSVPRTRVGPASPSLPWASFTVSILPLLALLVQFVTEDHPLAAGVKVFWAALVVGVAPGALIALAARPRARLTALELIGIGTALSLATVQALTLASILLHAPATAIAVTHVGLVVSGVAILVIRERSGTVPRVTLPRSEAIVAGLLAVLAALLYAKGSPLMSDEEQIHAAIIRRFAYLPHPAIDNFYHVPGLVYTHPFPGIHYFMALVSVVGGIDPLFVYHKLRFFWGPAAFIFLYLAARHVFRSTRLVLATFVTAYVFALNGTFADVPVLFWAQLVPYSHPSDVAMSVLLPALLVMAFSYYRSRGRRESIFFLLSTLAVATLVAIVHVREMVQFLVYTTCFFIAVALYRRGTRYLKRMAVLLAASVLVTVAYTEFHKLSVGHVAASDQTVKQGILDTLRGASLVSLFAEPAPVIFWLDSILVGWSPLVLAASPLVLWMLRRKTPLLLAGASIFAYLAIIRFPVLALPYVYLTYYEMLLTPVRNFAFFIHLLAGASLYLLACALARIRIMPLAMVAALACSALLALAWRDGETFLAKRRDLFFLPILAGYATVAVALWMERRRPGVATWHVRPSRMWPFVFAALLVPLVWLTAVPARSPLALHAVTSNMRPFPAEVDGPFFTPRALLDNTRCLYLAEWSIQKTIWTFPYDVPARDVVACPPSYQLARWAATALPIDAVVATNGFNAYGMPAYLPQQVPAWPPFGTVNIHNVRSLLPRYYEQFDRAAAAHGTQPFFNTSESLEERLEFVWALGVTHVLVDPMYHDDLARTLAQWPAHFQPLYDDGRWAVYEVIG